MSKWFDQEKVDAMGFDDSEWNKTIKILDDPNISDEEKRICLDNYKKYLFKKMGVKGYE
ncbi:MAG: hypothetical protein IKV87_06220 [Methanobrevibacter sp.]|nr:hypothetical protein [Methanobrevibacter sp.]